MAKKAETTTSNFVTASEAPTVTTANTDRLDSLRLASASKDKEARLSTTSYARELLSLFGANFWRKASPNFKQWQEERAKYDAVLKAKEHPNPSQAHTRLIDAADAICNPKAPGAPRTKTALVERANKEATALYKAFLREEEKVGLDDAEKRAFSGLITYMTEALKMDLNSLDK